MNKKHASMMIEATENLIDTLQWFEGDASDLHHECFNTDYYIIGTYQAKQALDEYDVYDAIELVTTYEQDNFGELYTDISDPEKLVNMLFYIVGYEVIDFLSIHNIDDINDDNREDIIDKLNNILK